MTTFQKGKDKKALIRKQVEKAIEEGFLVWLSIHMKRSRCCHIKELKCGELTFFDHDYLNRDFCLLAEVDSIKQLTKKEIEV